MRGLFVILCMTLAGFAATPPQPAPDVQPVVRVRELARLAPRTPVVVRGVVTRYRSGRSIAVQDQTGGIFAYTESTDPLVPGDVVEITGIANVDSEASPSIDKATYRKVGATAAPPAIPVTGVEISLGRHDADLVAIDGTLERVEAGRYEYGLVMRAGDVGFTAWVLREEAAGVPSISSRSRLRLTGVVSLKAPAGPARGFELLMRTGGDMVILQSPSWWTFPRIAATAVALAGIVAVLLSYVLLLRRQVDRQTAVIRRQLHAETQLTEQYRQAQKMEAIGRLAGGIAHDFNNIMTIVLGYSEVLEQEIHGHADQMAAVHEIKNAAERAATLTRQLLAFGRRQRLESTTVDLNAVVHDMQALFTRVLGGAIDVVAEPADGPVTVITDHAQLEQALLNLAVNARDAMPDGGKLTMSVAHGRNGAGEATGLIRVTDTGSGIPPEAQPHIFDPFYTTKDVGQGSGLGLAMVHGFVEQSGGTVRFETTVGQGTTFELAFPVVARAQKPVAG